jgi:hypothetical protein
MKTHTATCSESRRRPRRQGHPQFTAANPESPFLPDTLAGEGDGARGGGGEVDGGVDPGVYGRIRGVLKGCAEGVR